MWRRGGNAATAWLPGARLEVDDAPLHHLSPSGRGRLARAARKSGEGDTCIEFAPPHPSPLPDGERGRAARVSPLATKNKPPGGSRAVIKSSGGGFCTAVSYFSCSFLFGCSLLTQ